MNIGFILPRQSPCTKTCYTVLTVTPQPLGQHFYPTPAGASRIAQIVIESGTLTGGTCIEIGAGHGEILARLAEVAAQGNSN